MKKLNYKIIGTLFTIIVLLLIGVFDLSYATDATEEANLDEIKETVVEAFKSIDTSELIPQLQAGLLGANADKAKEVENMMTDELKKMGMKSITLHKNNDITNWKEGDHLKTRVGHNWYFDKKWNGISSGKLYFDSETKLGNIGALGSVKAVYINNINVTSYEELNNLSELELNMDENDNDEIKEGINLFLIIVIYDGAKVTNSSLGNELLNKDKIPEGIGAVPLVIEIEPKVINVTGITLSMNNKDVTNKKDELKVGEKATLIATVSPSNATNKVVTWKSATPAVASVNNNGEITALKEGTCTITATAGGRTARFYLTVKNENVEVTSIEINGKSELNEGDSTKLNAKVLPEDATDKTVTWSSSNTEIATVDAEGKVEAKKAGEVTITVVAKNNVKKEFTINIKGKEEPPVNNIIPDKDDNRTQTLVGKLFTYLRQILSKAFEALKKIFKK